MRKSGAPLSALRRMNLRLVGGGCRDWDAGGIMPEAITPGGFMNLLAHFSRREGYSREEGGRYN